jgi:hypothetical protein
MHSIFDAKARAELRGRLERLSPHSRRRWGVMSAGQAQVHLADQLRIALGRKQIKDHPSPMRLPPVRWLIIHVVPWPKGAPTAPELMNPVTGNWDADHRELLTAIDQVAALGEGHDWAPHPAFGKLSGHSWGVLMWRHLDHHLRQFGM